MNTPAVDSEIGAFHLATIGSLNNTCTLSDRDTFNTFVTHIMDLSVACQVGLQNIDRE